MSNFIPALHFDDPSTKLTPEWCMKAVHYFYYNSTNVNLLAGKNVPEIDGYASGEYDMLPFKKMFKSMKQKLLTAQKNPDGTLTEAAHNIDTVGIDWERYAIIPGILNSAVENIMKIPMDITCTAQDALAMKKRKEDIEFLENKPVIEADLQDIADQLQVGKVDIGKTKHSSTKFSGAPMGLDLANPEHKAVFMKLFYSLRVETAFQKFLKQFGNIKNMEMIRRLLATDHFKYAVAVVDDFTSSMTGLPDVEYIFPGDVSCPVSKLPDFSDRTHDITDRQLTVMEMFNFFSDEIESLDDLEKIINGKKDGYCACNKKGVVDQKNWSSFKVNLKLMEVKSVDWIGISEENGRKSFTTDASKSTRKIWAQNTYRFWWLANTNYCFGIQRLPFSHRSKGKESFQNFSKHIYKSQQRSAVQLCIGENKMAQIAYIKLQHALIKSLPAGKYIDLRFLRSALEGLKTEDATWTQQDLINLALEQNILIGDTQDFDGKNDGQFKPIIELAGGLKAEVTGYFTTIFNARQNCAVITGINQQLTGQQPEELIGLQELQISSGLTAINYCNIGVQHQLEGVNNNWGSYLQGAIEAGGETKKGIVNYVGEEDVELIDSLDEAPLHTLTIAINFGQRAFQMQAFQNQLNFLKSKGILTTTDEYLLMSIDDPKEKFQKLYFVEEKWKAEQARIREEGYAQQQALMAKQGENMAQAKQVETKGDIEVVYAKGEVQAKILELANRLGLGAAQTEGLIKMALQKDRNAAQKDKGIATIREKANIKQQEAIA